MTRLYALLFAAAIAFQALAAPASATPPSYDIFCSAGFMPEASEPADAPVHHFSFSSTLVSFDQYMAKPSATCGWFTRSWRPGEPTQLCVSDSELHALEAAGVVSLENGRLAVQPQISSFAVYNDFAGCMVVTGFAGNMSHAFAPTTLICQDIVNPSMPAGMAGAIPAEQFFAGSKSQTLLAPHHCYDVNGAPLPPSGMLCLVANGSPRVPTTGTVALSVTPWWPCGIAVSATGPVPGFTPPAVAAPSGGVPTPTTTGAATLDFVVPVAIDVPAVLYPGGAHQVTCTLGDTSATWLTHPYGETGRGIPQAATAGNRAVLNATAQITLRLLPANASAFPTGTAMQYTCQLELAGTSTAIAVTAGRFVLPATTETITTTPIAYVVP